MFIYFIRGEMKNLRSAIAVRILDSLGVVSNEMNDIRNDIFLHTYDGSKIYSGRVNYCENQSVVFLYTEVCEEKYMITFLEDDRGSEATFTFCIVSADVETENPKLNKLIIGTKSANFREVSFLEGAKILNTFEIIRNHMPNWGKNKPTETQFQYLLKFIESIRIE